MIDAFSLQDVHLTYPSPISPVPFNSDRDVQITFLVERYQKPILAFLFRRLPDDVDRHEVAEEIAADVFARVVEKWHTWQPPSQEQHAGAPIAGWLFTIAHRRFIDWGRKHQTRERLHALSIDESPALAADFAQDDSILNKKEFGSDRGSVAGPVLRADQQCVIVDTRPSISIEMVGVRMELVAAIKQLTPRQRTVVDLVDLGGCSVTEASRTLGIQVSSVVKARWRAFASLRKILEEDAQ